MNAEALHYSWQDERQGIWTVITEESDRVIVRLSAAHRRGRVASVLMAFAVATIFTTSLTRTSTIGAVVAIIVAGACVAFIGRVLNRQPNPIVLEVHDARPDQPAENVFGAVQVKQMVVRMNSGRTHDDWPAWQLYLDVGGEHARLIYQAHGSSSGRRRVQELAQRLSARWNVRLTVID